MPVEPGTAISPSVRFGRFLHLATLKSTGCYIISSVQKFAFECPSVHLCACPTACPSIRQRFVSTLFQVHFQPIIFFKLGIRVDIGKECPGIADGKISTNKYRVMTLD